MMENKAQMNVGMLIMLFISVLVGAILLTTIAGQVSTTTDTQTLVNLSATAAANGDSFYLTDYKSLAVTSIINGTNGATIAAGNYTVTNNVVYNGAEAVKITVDDAEFESETWFINGVAQPITYIGESGGRAMASLITVFFALAILAAALWPIYSSKLLEMMGR